MVTEAELEVGFEGAESALSASQRRLWFLSQYDEDDAYVIALATRFRGPLDIDALRAAHRMVSDRHEVLRTTFIARDGVPVARVGPPGAIDFTVEDIDDLPGFTTAAVSAPFDLSDGPVWRIRVGRISAEDHVLVTVIHHIAADGWSFPVLRDEVSTAYRALVAGTEPDLAPLTSQYRDHASTGPIADDDLDYWRQRFGDDPDPLPVLGHKARPHRRSQDGGWAPVGPMDSTASQLREVAGRAGASPFIVGLAIFASFLGRITRSDEVIVGIPHADRSNTAAHGLIGPFVNTLPLRISLPAGATLLDQVAIVRDEVVAALDHATVPLEEIVSAAKPRRDPSHTPLFQVMYQFHDGAFRSRYDLPGVTEENIRVGGATSKFDLLAEMTGIDGSLTGSLNFSTDILDGDTGSALARSLGALTDAALASPETALDRHPLLDRWERDWVVNELNSTRRDYPDTYSLWELFETVAMARPDDTAVAHGDLRVSYRRLHQTAIAIRQRLIALGVGPGEAVGLEMDRSVAMVASTLAVIASGAAYVPLDPSYPETRREKMVELSGLRCVITTDPRAPEGVEVRAMGTDRSTSIPADAAYIMFTSGSTGRPKGTVIPHRAVVRLVCNPDYVSLGAGDVVAHLSNTSFDASTFEIWGALLNGATLRVLDKETVVDPAAFADAVAGHGVTTMFVTTALFNLIARHRPDAFSGVRDVLFGGERCNPEAVRAVIEAGPPRRLVHVYGPTESTTFASWHLVPADESVGDTVPIGHPIANTTLHVVDRSGEPVPAGVVGELWIGGPGLAVGYLDEPELTAERFVPDPFGEDPWGRLYRTGDLVWRRHDGAIEFLGRNDRQVKMRGFRVEPEEVETALRSHPGVSDAVAAVVGTGSDARLLAWAVPADGFTIDPEDLLGHLRQSLPGYTVPAAVHPITAIPIAPGGKVDLSALPTPVTTPNGRQQPIAGPTRTMVEAFEKVLGVEGIGPDDSFFDLGGHSLLAVELVALTERLTGHRLPLASLFDDATPAGLARLIENPTTEHHDGLVTFVEGDSDTPVFLFHHPSGTVLAYEPLARRIGLGKTVYGIQARGIDGVDRPADTIGQMATEYADRIERVNPDGSCVLAGHSLGGLIAWETARVLRSRGRDVALLALLDSRVPHKGWVEVGGEVRKLNTWGMLRRQARRIGGDLFYGARYFGYGLRRAAVPPELSRIRQIRTSSRAFESYRPKPLDEPVVFFLAHGSGGNRPVPGGRPSEDDWRQLAASVEVVPVPGTHTGDDSLLAEPNVEVLAAELRVRIAAAIPAHRTDLLL